MNWSEVELLLRRYWEGETSLQEEQILKNAFSRNDVPKNLVSLKNYFVFTTKQKEIKHPNQNVENQFLEQLNKYKNRPLNFSKIIAYAAVFLILITSGFFLKQSFQPKYKPLTEKEIRIAHKYLDLMAESLTYSENLASTNLEKLSLLNKAAETLQPYEITYLAQFKNLNHIERINYSINQLKPIKTFEYSGIKL